MAHFLWSYWWLIFPIGFFIFGAWDRWLDYRRSQDRLDLLRSYASQGKDPPPELLRALQREEEEDDAADLYVHGGRRIHRRLYRRYWRYGPYWAWRTAVVTGAVAAGFWFASVYADIPGTEWPFRLVAVIMTCVAVGHAVVALFSTVFRPR
jgi:hypothetical protein